MQFFFFFYTLTLELQIITLCNVCPGFLETSTLKCGHMSNNVPQSIVILILVTFLPSKSPRRKNSPHGEKIIWYRVSHRLLQLSIPRLDFHVFFVDQSNTQYFSPPIFFTSVLAIADKWLFKYMFFIYSTLLHDQWHSANFRASYD